MLLLLLFPLCAQAQMYKCVDERGATQYTDKPQAGCKPAAIKGSPPLSGELAPRKENFANQDAELKRRQLEREIAERQQGQALTQRCAKLRQERAILSSGRRISKFDAKGERVFMDDAVRDQRLAQLEQELRGCP